MRRGCEQMEFYIEKLQETPPTRTGQLRQNRHLLKPTNRRQLRNLSSGGTASSWSTHPCRSQRRLGEDERATTTLLLPPLNLQQAAGVYDTSLVHHQASRAPGPLPYGPATPVFIRRLQQPPRNSTRSQPADAACSGTSGADAWPAGWVVSSATFWRRRGRIRPKNGAAGPAEKAGTQVEKLHDTIAGERAQIRTQAAEKVRLAADNERLNSPNA